MDRKGVETVRGDESPRECVGEQNVDVELDHHRRSGRDDADRSVQHEFGDQIDSGERQGAETFDQ